MVADVAKVKRNIKRMVDAGAPETDIDAYLTSEGVTTDQLKATPAQPQASSYLGKIGDAVSGAIGQVGKDYVAQRQRDVSNSQRPLGEQLRNAPGDLLSQPFKDVGQLAGDVLNIPNAGITEAVRPAATAVSGGLGKLGIRAYPGNGNLNAAPLDDAAAADQLTNVFAQAVGLAAPERGIVRANMAGKLASKVRPATPVEAAAPKTVDVGANVQSTAARPMLRANPAQKAALEAKKADITVAKTVKKYLGKDKLTPQAYRQALQDAPAGALPYDLAGKSMLGATDAVANSAGGGAGVLADASLARRGQAVTRIKEAVGKSLGGKGDYFDNLGKMVDAKKAAASEGMAKIGQTQVPLDEHSVAALRSDRAKAAVKDEAMNLLASVNPEDRNIGAMLNGLHDKVLDNPAGARLDIQSAQNISKALLDAGQSAWRTDPSKGKALTGLGKAIRNNVRQQVPEYDSWLKNYAEASGNEGALDLGRNILEGRGKVPYEQLKKAHADFSDVDRLNYQKGVGEAVFEMARQKGVNSARNLIKSEDFADRVRLAFPDEAKFTSFMDAMKREVKYANTDQQMFGNSQTFKRSEFSADMSNEGADPIDMALTGLDAAASPQTLPLKALKLLNKARLNAAPKSVLNNEAANVGLGRALSDPQEMSRILDIIVNDLAVNPLEFIRASKPAKEAVAAVVRANNGAIPEAAKVTVKAVIRGKKSPQSLAPYLVVTNLGRGGTIPAMPYAGSAAAQEEQTQ